MANNDNNATAPNFENRLTTPETNFAVFVQEMKDLKAEMKDFKQEMRDRDNRRAAEAEEIRNDIKEIYKTTDAKIQALDGKILEIRQSVQTMQNQNVVVIIGVIAIAVAVFLK